MSDTETCEVAPLAEDYREQNGLALGDKVLSRIMQNSKAFPFSRPVDVEGLGLTDYFNIVKTPMDLGTVRKKLRKKLYRHPDELREDIELTFTNAMIYNPATDDVHQWAKELKERFTRQWENTVAEFMNDNNEDMCRKCGLGGLLLLCDFCPAAFHKVCIGLKDDPDEDAWRCPDCISGTKTVLVKRPPPKGKEPVTGVIDSTKRKEPAVIDLTADRNVKARRESLGVSAHVAPARDSGALKGLTILVEQLAKGTSEGPVDAAAKPEQDEELRAFWARNNATRANAAAAVALAEQSVNGKEASTSKSAAQPRPTPEGAAGGKAIPHKAPGKRPRVIIIPPRPNAGVPPPPKPQSSSPAPPLATTTTPVHPAPTGPPTRLAQSPASVADVKQRGEPLPANGTAAERGNVLRTEGSSCTVDIPVTYAPLHSPAKQPASQGSPVALFSKQPTRSLFFKELTEKQLLRQEDPSPPSAAPLRSVLPPKMPALSASEQRLRELVGPKKADDVKEQGRADSLSLTMERQQFERKLQEQKAQLERALQDSQTQVAREREEKESWQATAFQRGRELEASRQDMGTWLRAFIAKAHQEHDVITRKQSSELVLLLEAEFPAPKQAR